MPSRRSSDDVIEVCVSAICRHLDPHPIASKLTDQHQKPTPICAPLIGSQRSAVCLVLQPLVRFGTGIAANHWPRLLAMLMALTRPYASPYMPFTQPGGTHLQLSALYG